MTFNHASIHTITATAIAAAGVSASIDITVNPIAAAAPATGVSTPTAPVGALPEVGSSLRGPMIPAVALLLGTGVVLMRRGSTIR